MSPGLLWRQQRKKYDKLTKIVKFPWKERKRERGGQREREREREGERKREREGER